MLSIELGGFLWALGVLAGQALLKPRLHTVSRAFSEGLGLPNLFLEVRAWGGKNVESASLPAPRSNTAARELYRSGIRLRTTLVPPFPLRSPVHVHARAPSPVPTASIPRTQERTKEPPIERTQTKN